jgi:hypothetical protein
MVPAEPSRVRLTVPVPDVVTGGTWLPPLSEAEAVTARTEGAQLSLAADLATAVVRGVYIDVEATRVRKDRAVIGGRDAGRCRRE